MSILSQLKSQFPDYAWQPNASLASYTYMRVGGPAEVLWVAQELDELVEVLRFAQANALPYILFGGASNLVIRDGGLEGLVIINHCIEGDCYSSQESVQAELGLGAAFFTAVPPFAQFVLAQSGTPMAYVVGQATERALTGLEPFVGVPGSLGGAIYNNSHYQKELIGDWVAAIEVLTPQGKRVWLSQADAEFAYDDSRFQRSGEIILQVLFYALPGDPERIQEKLQESSQKRANTQPLATANSGCVFKNVSLTPEQQAQYPGKTTLPAGWLIDQCGLKGTKVGGAEVSTLHANFIVNTGTATSKDIEDLITLIQTKVKERFGIELEKEVFFLGKES